MKVWKIALLGGTVACLAIPSLSAQTQGLLGQRYFGVDGGWERWENGDSDDGWGVGAELNIPGPMDRQAVFGLDLNVRGDYVDVFDNDIYDVEGVIRAYTMAGDNMFKPFVGAGFGWVDFDVVDSTYVPVEAGVEFGGAGVSLMPYFRYNFALDSDVDDFWSAGVKGVYWVDDVWGLTAAFDYRDYDDTDAFQSIDTAWTVRAGIVIAY